MPSISAIAWISRPRSAIAAVVHRPAIGVDVLAEQVDFAHALLGELRDFGQHVVERAADFLAARVRHDAERAVLRAAFHDRDERGRAFGARLGQAVELLDFGETRCRPAACRSRGALRSVRGRRCSVCGPNTRSTYGARLTIASPSWLATQPPTPISTRLAVLLQLLPAAELAEHFFLRLLADRAGVDQDDVGFGLVLRSAPGRARAPARRPSWPSRTRSSGSRGS